MVSPISPETLNRADEFMGLYADWLEARAAYKRPNPQATDAAINRLDNDLATVTRSFLTTPAAFGWMIWHKLEVFDFTIGESDDIGQYSLREAVWMWGCIKADMMRFGFRNEEGRL